MELDDSIDDSPEGGRLKTGALVGVVETALTEALRAAVAAKRWEVVAQLADELATRRRRGRSVPLRGIEGAAMDRTRMTRRPTPPGEILRDEFLIPLEMSQKELADHIDQDVKIINRIVNGRSAVTAEVALKLGAAFRTTPEFWLNAQKAVDLHEARANSVAFRSRSSVDAPPARPGCPFRGRRGGAR